jgi:alpha-beta hydrolase superfamily lysophospholipase
LWLADHVAPKWQLSGSGLHILPSDNIPMLREFSRDPLVIKETRVDSIKGLVRIMSEALEAAPQVKQRTLLLYGAHDELIPADPMKQFANALPRHSTNEDTIAYYDDGYHMLLRDLEGAKVAADVEDWIFHPDAKLPSGADVAGAEKFLPTSPALNAKLGVQARANQAGASN